MPNTSSSNSSCCQAGKSKDDTSPSVLRALYATMHHTVSLHTSATEAQVKLYWQHNASVRNKDCMSLSSNLWLNFTVVTTFYMWQSRHKCDQTSQLWQLVTRIHLLVAPIMKTVFFEFMPSISVSNWLRTLSAAPPASPADDPLWFAILSSSSKNRTHGADCLALSNISRTLASLSPNHMVSSSGPLMLMKFAWHSLAIAFASSVLPHPATWYVYQCYLISTIPHFLSNFEYIFKLRHKSDASTCRMWNKPS